MRLHAPSEWEEAEISCDSALFWWARAATALSTPVLLQTGMA
jgi:hypothetical protein